VRDSADETCKQVCQHPDNRAAIRQEQARTRLIENKVHKKTSQFERFKRMLTKISFCQHDRRTGL